MDLIKHFENARNAVVIEAGQTIFKQGQRGTVMYVLLDDEPRSASVVARTACRVVPIPQAQFDLLVQETPEFARRVMASLTSRLRHMNQSVPAAQLVASRPRVRPAHRLAA